MLAPSPQLISLRCARLLGRILERRWVQALIFVSTFVLAWALSGGTAYA